MRPYVTILLALSCLAACAGEAVLVENGVPKAVRQDGKAWTQGNGYLECGGTGNYLMAERSLGAGDFRIRARLSLHGLGGTAASFTVGNSHFGFDSHKGKHFVEGPLLGGKTQMLGPCKVAEGKPFAFEAVRKGKTLSFLIDGETLHACTVPTRALGAFGFRPWRSTMRIYDFRAEGDLTIPPKPLEGQVVVFRSGTEGYHTFRIPAILVSPKGDLLAFCEGRKNSGGDTGDIDVVMKRSSDGGKTWSKLQVVADHGPHVIGNPCPVVDAKTGTILMPLTRNRGDEPESAIKKGTTKEPRTVWLSRSTDDGHTWTEPVDISATTRQPHWRWYATGPGVGIQLRSGRILIPCDHSDHSGGGHPFRSHAIFSDDGGKTWGLSDAIVDSVNECQAVELADGSVLMNMRSYHRGNRRHVSRSTDGGKTWTPPVPDETLIEPVCQASLLRYSLAGPAGGENRLLFSNPASTSRVNMTVRLSTDEGKTWPVSRTINPGPSAYSCLVVLPDTTIGCLYECGPRSAYQTVTFAHFTLDWLLGREK